MSDLQTFGSSEEPLQTSKQTEEEKRGLLSEAWSKTAEKELTEQLQPQLLMASIAVFLRLRCSESFIKHTFMNIYFDKSCVRLVVSKSNVLLDRCPPLGHLGSSDSDMRKCCHLAVRRRNCTGHTVDMHCGRCSLWPGLNSRLVLKTAACLQVSEETSAKTQTGFASAPEVVRGGLVRWSGSVGLTAT